MSEFNFDFRELVEVANDVIVVTKAYPLHETGPEIVYVNRAFTELTGYSFEEAVGQTPRMLQTEETSKESLHRVQEALDQGLPVREKILNRSKDGRDYWLDMNIVPLRDADGTISHFAAIERDVTLAEELQEKLVLLASSDPLTGALNRRAFTDCSQREFLRFQRGGHPYSVLVVDIDYFKKINDRYGHAAGDIALKALVEKIESKLRPYDRLARMGGEEFAVILPRANLHAAMEIAQRFRRAIADLELDQIEPGFSMTASIGVATALKADTTEDEILKRADRALYAAKDSGRNCVRNEA